MSNHLADRWADKAQLLPECQQTYALHGSWDVLHDGEAVTGALRKTLQDILVEQHWKQGLVKAGKVRDTADMDCCCADAHRM